MKKAILFGTVFIILTYPVVKAGTFSSDCPDLKSCASAVAELTGKKYLLPQKFKGTVVATDNLELTSENADRILSEILNEAGYTRVPVDENTIRIISSRDVRYIPTPKVQANFNKLPELPNTSDYFMMSYTLKNSVTAKPISRSLRPFLSRYGRIIHIDLNGTILVQDTAKNLKRFYSLIKELDINPTKTQKAHWAKKLKHRQRLELLKVKGCKHHEKGVKK